jgi:hypothetical protein
MKTMKKGEQFVCECCGGTLEVIEPCSCMEQPEACHTGKQSPEQQEHVLHQARAQQEMICACGVPMTVKSASRS